MLQTRRTNKIWKIKGFLSKGQQDARLGDPQFPPNCVNNDVHSNSNSIRISQLENGDCLEVDSVDCVNTSKCMIDDVALEPDKCAKDVSTELSTEQRNVQRSAVQNTSHRLCNSMSHEPVSADNTGVVHISNIEGQKEVNLDPSNMTVVTLPSNEKLICLIDSGATTSLVCNSVVQESRFLSKLPKQSLQPIKFTVGNGETIVSNHTIEFPFKIEEHSFVVRAMIINNLGGVGLVLGQASLAELDAKLTFKSNKLEFKSKSVLLFPSTNYVIDPQQTRYITVTAKLPKFLKNSSIRIKSNKYFSRLCPEMMLVKFKKSEAVVLAKNDSQFPIILNKSRSVGTVELQSLTDLYDPVDSFTQKNGQTTLHLHSYQQRQDYPEKPVTNLNSIIFKTGMSSTRSSQNFLDFLNQMIHD